MNKYCIVCPARLPAEVRSRVHVPLHGPGAGVAPQPQPLAVAALRLRIHLRQVTTPAAQALLSSCRPRVESANCKAVSSFLSCLSL